MPTYQPNYGYYKKKATNEERLELIRKTVKELNECLQDEHFCERIFQKRIDKRPDGHVLNFPRVHTSDCISQIVEVFNMLTWDEEE